MGSFSTSCEAAKERKDKRKQLNGHLWMTLVHNFRLEEILSIFDGRLGKPVFRYSDNFGKQW